MNKVILLLAAVGVAAALPPCSGPDSTSFKLGKGASKLKCADLTSKKKKCNQKGKDRGVKIKAKKACPAACGRCVPDAAPTPRPTPRPTAPAEECERAKKGFCAKASTQKCAKKKYADKCPRCGSCVLCRDDKKWRAKSDGLSCKRLAKKAGKRKDPAAYLKKLCKRRKGADGAKMKVACPETCDALAETCAAPDETPTAAPTAAAANTTMPTSSPTTSPTPTNTTNTTAPANTTMPTASPTTSPTPANTTNTTAPANTYMPTTSPTASPTPANTTNTTL